MKNKMIQYLRPAFTAVLLLLVTVAVSVSCGIPVDGEVQPGANPSVDGEVQSGANPSVDGTVPADSGMPETVGEIPSPDSPCANGHTYVELDHRDPTCFSTGAVAYYCTVCNGVFDEEIIPRKTHEFVDGYCTLCGLNEGAETFFSYTFDLDTQTYILAPPRGQDHMSDGNWGTKETVILPCVADDGLHGVHPVSGFWKLFYYNTFIRNVIIPEGYTLIGEGAFDHAVNIEAIEIPSTVTTIGKNAFNGDYKIRHFDLPEGLTTIGENAFGYCGGLEEIQLPSSLTSLGPGAFQNTSIRSIVLPESLTVVTGDLFSGCRNLTQVVMPDTITKIGSNAFEGTAIEQLDIPAGVTYIGSHAFSYCNIRRVVIPEGIEYFLYAFHDCPYLEEVVLPDSLTTLAQGQFSNCPMLKSINIPLALESLHHSVLGNCPSLEEVTIAADHPTLGLRDGLLYSKTDGTLIRVLGSLTELVIPDDGTITAIGFGLCQGNTNLTRVVIPGCVKEIGVSAFADCKNLSSVELGEGVSFFGCWCFSGCTSLTSFTFPASAVTIEAKVLLNCSNLREVTIPKAFDAKFNSYRHECLFEGCKSLERVNYAGTLKKWMTSVNPFTLETLSNPAGDYVVYCSDGEYDLHHSEKYIEDMQKYQNSVFH